MFKPCICAQLQPNYLHSFHWKLFDFPWQRAMKCIQQTEVEFSALLPSHTVPAFLHVRKRKPTLVYFWMRQMLRKRSVRRWPYLPLILFFNGNVMYMVWGGRKCRMLAWCNIICSMNSSVRNPIWLPLPCWISKKCHISETV